MNRLRLAATSLAVVAVVAAAACSSKPASTPAATQSPQATSQPTKGPTSAPTSLPTSVPTPGVPADSSLSLVISQPQNEIVVTGGLLKVAGRAAPDAVVSVDGTILKAIDVDGNFTTVLSLAEGPNLIEVIATDYQGNQVAKVLTVVYAPQG